MLLGNKNDLDNEKKVDLEIAQVIITTDRHYKYI